MAEHGYTQRFLFDRTGVKVIPAGEPGPPCIACGGETRIGPGVGPHTRGSLHQSGLRIVGMAAETKVDREGDGMSAAPATAGRIVGISFGRSGRRAGRVD